MLPRALLIKSMASSTKVFGSTIKGERLMTCSRQGKLRSRSVNCMVNIEKDLSIARLITLYRETVMYEELYNLGLEKARQGDLAGAIKEFSRALKVNPQFSDAYYKRAVTRFDFGDLQGAIEDYNKLLQMHPDHINAYCGRGLTNLALGNMEAAIEDATQATRINPKQAQAYSLRGTACQRLGNVQAAIANFKKAAEIYLEQKDAVKCRQCIETIKKLQNAENQTKNPPFNPEEFINEALKKSISGDYGGAIGDLDWVIQLNPQEDKAYFHRGLIYARLESNWSAIEEFNQTIRLKPSHAEAYYHRGIARSAT
ncbi:MAG TPA: hypothetical protein DCY88_23455, partial [Cyanobacteria bacterium UBA11372]|nr:hypothetical protein [Cyanobacteria bacterium UBA11372]